MRLVVTEGQVADISFASEMIEHLRAKAVMPPRSNWETKCHYGRALHRTRNLVERFFNRVRHFLRGSARYNKLADSHFVFASLACVSGPPGSEPLASIHRAIGYVSADYINDLAQLEKAIARSTKPASFGARVSESIR